jgi:hemoglobin/transferrin/lactoferrin receptor protein
MFLLKKRQHMPLALWAFAILPGVLSASDSSTKIEEESAAGPALLNTVKVTAQSIDADVQISADAIELEQAWNTSDLFELTPQIDIGGGGANAKRLYLRGIAESLVSITIDGAKQSKDLHQHRGGLAGVDAELLKSVEVDAGPTAADRGPGNVGGSIRMTTKDAQDMLTGERPYGLFVKSAYGSAAEGWKNSLAAYAVADYVGILAYVSDSDSENYRAGNGETMLGTAEESRTYFAKLSLLNVKNHDLRITAEETTQEGLYKWGSTGSDMGPLTDETLANRQKSERKTLTLNHEFNPVSDYIHTEFSAYSNNASLENLDSDSKYESEGRGGDLKNTMVLDFDGIESNITFGVDYQEEEGISTNGTVTSENTGFFVQNRMNYKALGLSFGVRYDDYETDFDGKKISGSATSPNINGDIALGGGFSLYAGYGESVSGANTIPVGWLTNIAEELKFNGDLNGTLEAETSKKVEGGIKYGKKSVFFDSDRLNAKITLFNTKVEDAVIVGTGGRRGAPISDVINDDDIETQGIEISASWSYDRFDAILTFAHNDVEKNGETLVGTVKRSASNTGDRLVFNPQYNLSKQWNFGYTLTVVMKNDDGTEGNDNNGSYTLHGIQAQYHPEFLENSTISISVSNLFDKVYSKQTSIASSGETVLEPGRDIRVSFSYNF